MQTSVVYVSIGVSGCLFVHLRKNMSTIRTDYEYLNKVKVSPSNNTISFPNSIDREYKQEITIMNPTDLQMTYRIICSSPELGFHPLCGYVKPEDKTVVEVFIGPPFQSKKKTKLGFIVRWVIAGTNCPANAKDMWIANVVPNKLYQTVKMKVVFTTEPEEKSKSDRSSTKDDSSTSEAIL